MGYLLGGFAYPSKAAVERRAREIRDAVGTGRVTDPDHVAFLFGLIDLHPDRDAKFGSHVEHFEVRPNEFGSGTGFVAVRHNGTTVTFSCSVKGKPTPLADRVAEAMREAVYPSIAAYRREHLNEDSRCALCDDPLDEQSARVDHHAPRFRALREGWLATCGGIGVIETARTTGTHLHRFADKVLRDTWRAYHDQHASLRLVCEPCNQIREHLVDVRYQGSKARVGVRSAWPGLRDAAVAAGCRVRACTRKCDTRGHQIHLVAELSDRVATAFLAAEFAVEISAQAA